MFETEGSAKLYDEFGAKVRLHGRTLEGLPMLDALLPYFEYNQDQLQRSPFLDEWLSAVLRAEASIAQAAEILQPLGIGREDLLLLLHKNMKARLKEQKKRALR